MLPVTASQLKRSQTIDPSSRKKNQCFTAKMSRSSSVPRDPCGRFTRHRQTRFPSLPTTTTMSTRPLPALPTHQYQYPPRSTDRYLFASPYHVPHHYPQYRYPQDNYPDLYEEPATSSFPVGTILHKGFYDLLSMIPTPSPSRFLSGWRASPPSNNDSVAGPRYEELDTARIKAMPKKGRRVSKDMVSKPTGFV